MAHVWTKFTIKEASITSFTHLSPPDPNLHFSFVYCFHVFCCLKAVCIVEFVSYPFYWNTPLIKKWTRPIEQLGWWAPAKESCQQNIEIHRKRKTVELELRPLEVIYNKNIKITEPRIDLTCFSPLPFFLLFLLLLSCLSAHQTTHTHRQTHTCKHTQGLFPGLSLLSLLSLVFIFLLL